MQKLMIGLTAALAILLAGSAQSAFAGSKKSSANQPNHTATATTSKQSNHTVTSTHSKRTTSTAKKSSATRVKPNANGKHIPEASITVRKTRGNDWNCILFPSLCVGPRPKAQQAH
jgi:Flp pilus assembly protein TadB